MSSPLLTVTPDDELSAHPRRWRARRSMSGLGLGIDNRSGRGVDLDKAMMCAGAAYGRAGANRAVADGFARARQLVAQHWQAIRKVANELDRLGWPSESDVWDTLAGREVKRGRTVSNATAIR